MFVSVGYYDESLKAYKARPYTYETHIPLAVGAIVQAPVRNRGTGELENKRAVVLDIDLPKPTFPCNVITEIYEEDT